MGRKETCKFVESNRLVTGNALDNGELKRILLPHDGLLSMGAALRPVPLKASRVRRADLTVGGMNQGAG
jgi:hypothetical protein